MKYNVYTVVISYMWDVCLQQKKKEKKKKKEEKTK